MKFKRVVSLKAIKLQKKANPGEYIPWGYGIAYWDYCTFHAIAYPVPINLLVRWSRNLWQALTLHRPSKIDEELQKAYQKGRRDEAQDNEKLQSRLARAAGYVGNFPRIDGDN